MSSNSNIFRKTSLSLLALCSSLGACGAAEDQTVSAASGPKELSSEIGSVVEAVFFADPIACGTFDAEDRSAGSPVTRSGGSASSSGWNLRAAGDSVGFRQSYTSGEHFFTIVAWGTAGSDGSKPNIKLSLNGFAIGGNVAVTNTSRTDGWRRYVVSYTVKTPGEKVLKVELANPGAGRAVLIDGGMVHCPRQGVTCGSEPYAASCCTSTGTSGQCGEATATGTAFCDQHSDCASGEVCAYYGHGQNGFGITCQVADTCVSGGGTICGKLCKSPSMPEVPCGNGTVCTDVASDFMMAPGYKYCM
jgi:hypothetical protein